MNTINTFKLNTNTNKFTTRKTSPNTQSESLNKLVHLGETMISEKKFDIKKYLNTAEKHFKNNHKTKTNLSNLRGLVNYSTDYLNYKWEKPNKFSTFTKDNFYPNNIITNYKYKNESFNDYKGVSFNKDNLDKKIPNLNFYSFSTDKNKRTNLIINKKKNKIKYLNTFSNHNLNTKNKNNKPRISERYNNMFDDNKNLIKIITNDTDKNTNDNKSGYIYEYNKEDDDKKLFKIEKAVKQIKKNINKSFDFNKYLDKIKNFYDKKNVLAAIDSDIVLNNYKTKHKRLKDVDIPISTFITQNKEISINNLLIKLINKESDKLVKKEQDLNKNLKSDIYNVEDEEKRLEEYSDLQKSACKKIEMILTELQKKNRNLMGEEKKYRLEVKLKEYEIYKILNQMNLFRFYAKFANQILDGDTTRFEKPIISEDAEFDKVNFEPIIKEVLDNYSSMKKFDSKKDKNNNNKLIKYYKEEGYFLYDPELVYHKYNEMEGNILRLLKTKEKLILKIKKRQKQNNEALSYLIDRCKILQQEYDEIYNDYNEENQKYLNYLNNNGSTHINVNIHEKNNLIQDLYASVIDVLEPTVIKISKLNKREFNTVDRKDLSHFDEIVDYGQKVLENIELNLNCLLIKMKNDEQNDKTLFDKVIYGIKIDYKLLRQSNFFKNRIENERNQRNKIIEKEKKIVLKSKKSEPPYFNYKANKKEEINLNIVKRDEDKELMIYH